jgi:uncharacterized protein YkwD
LLAGLLFAPPVAHAQRSHAHTSQSVAPAFDETATARPSPDLARVAKDIVRLTNQFRGQKDRRRLRVNADLSRAAQYFANYLARTGKFSHTADGKEPWERTEQYGYDYCLVAENIAYRYSSAGFSTRELARGFMRGWRKSPGHRRNLLDPDTYDIGVGVAHSRKTGRYYAVQDFGRPRSNTITFRITNQADRKVDFRVDGKSYSIQPRYTITFQRCRPPKVQFAQAAGQGAGSTSEKTYRPHTGTHYVIRRDEDGRYMIATD